MGRTAIYPGEHLAEQLEALGMSATEMARQIKVPTNRITEILKGRRSITGDTALRLGHFFGTSPDFWINLQKLLRVAAGREQGWESRQETADARRAGRKRRRTSARAGKVSVCEALSGEAP